MNAETILDQVLAKRIAQCEADINAFYRTVKIHNLSAAIAQHVREVMMAEYSLRFLNDLKRNALACFEVGGVQGVLSYLRRRQLRHQELINRVVLSGTQDSEQLAEIRARAQMLVVIKQLADEFLPCEEAPNR